MGSGHQNVPQQFHLPELTPKTRPAEVEKRWRDKVGRCHAVRAGKPLLAQDLWERTWRGPKVQRAPFQRWGTQPLCMGGGTDSALAQSQQIKCCLCP